MAHLCHHCGAPWDGDPKAGRVSVCRRCAAPLHCCLNCRFYDRTRNNQCAEPAAEWVGDKAKGNFCEYFEWRHGAGDGGAEAERRRKVEDQIKNLFRD